MCVLVIAVSSTRPTLWEEQRKILRDAACGIAYLHSSVLPFIADFGFVTPLSETIRSTTVVNAAGALSLALSRGYLASEISDGKHGTSSDVYSYK